MGHSKQKSVCVCTWVLFRTVSEIRATSLYNSKIVYKKEILRSASNTGIYCSCDKVGTVCLL
jgi:hypothetical protein